MKRGSPNTPKASNGNGGLPEARDNFSFGSGLPFADNAEYASQNLPFDIVAIVREPGRGYDGKDRWALTIKSADRDREILTLGCNPKRDEELAAAQEHLGGGGTILNKRLVRRGNAYYVEDEDR